jgi:hypothetical protein
MSRNLGFGQGETDVYETPTVFEPSSKVLASILDSRLDQLAAITLPTDTHRLDILHTIQEIPSFQRRLACFLDYLIDYVATMGLDMAHVMDRELFTAQQNLTESHKYPTESRSSNCQIHDSDYRKSLKLLNVKSGNLQSSIRQLLDDNEKLRSEIRRREKSGPDPDSENFCYHETMNVKDLKKQFQQMESDLTRLTSDVQRKFAGIRRYS